MMLLLRRWLGLLAASICASPVAGEFDGSCTDGFANTTIGLGFNVTCNSWAYGLGGSLWAQTRSSWEDCYSMCGVSRYLCYGAQYNATNGTCWFFLTKQDSYPPTPAQGHHMAVVPLYELDVNYTACGFNSGINLVNGNNWNVSCNMTMPHGNMGDLGDPAYAYHAANLPECMGYCLDVHPLCKAVTWDPLLPSGYANCQLKNENISDGLSYVANPTYIGHTAEVLLPALNDTCAGDTVTFGDLQFDVLCQRSVGAGNMTNLHTDTLTQCIGNCSSTSECVAVNWNFDLTDGYRNCYLLATSQNIAAASKSNSKYHAASLTNSTSGGSATITTFSNAGTASSTSRTPGTSGTSTSATASPVSDATTSSRASATTNAAGATSSAATHSSNSAAWIAGPIVGGIAAIAVAAGIFLCCRRKRSRSATDAPEPDFGYVEAQIPQPTGPPPPPLPMAMPALMVPRFSQATSEGSVSMLVKYEPPVELLADYPPIVEMPAAPTGDEGSDDEDTDYSSMQTIEDSTLHAR